MSFCGVSELDRSSLRRLLFTAVLPIALTIASTSARAQTVVGASGIDGETCFTDNCAGGNGTDGQSVTADGNSVTTIGGNGGSGGSSLGPSSSLFVSGGNGGNGGTATSTGTGDANATGGAGGNGGSAFTAGPSSFAFGGNGGNGGAASASGTTNASATGGAGGNAGDFRLVGDAGSPGNGGDATATSSAMSSGSSDATSAASAAGGAGGNGITIGEFASSGAGGNATATSGATANGSGNATSSATATGGAGGFGEAVAGNATATSTSTANGSGGATASATATGGLNFAFPGVANATSSAQTANGGMAQALSSTFTNSFGEAQSTAKTSFGGVTVQSTVDAMGGGSTEAIAQGGSGQSPVNPGQFDGFTFSTALPNADYATTLIGSANNVANALLGPDDKIFGTAILGGGEGDEDSSTFDFSFRGDLILGVIDGGADIIVNGTELSAADGFAEDTVINLGSFGPNIDLIIQGEGVFAIGGAVPEASTWAMMLLGFAGLGVGGYRAKSRINVRVV